jgi:hypothetical protein
MSSTLLALRQISFEEGVRDSALCFEMYPLTYPFLKLLLIRTGLALEPKAIEDWVAYHVSHDDKLALRGLITPSELLFFTASARCADRPRPTRSASAPTTDAQKLAETARILSQFRNTPEPKPRSSVREVLKIDHLRSKLLTDLPRQKWTSRGVAGLKAKSVIWRKVSESNTKLFYSRGKQLLRYAAIKTQGCGQGYPAWRRAA